MTIVDPLISPRLASLRQEMAGGNIGALEAFWRDVAEHGTPLVEPIDGDDRHVLLTFLWRAFEGVDHVLLIGGPARWDGSNNRMAQLPGTDLWYRTYRVRADLRTTYRVSPDDSLVPFEQVEDWAARTATWQPDPLNPRSFIFPKDEEIADSIEHVLSVVELPGAPQQPFSERRAHAPAGRLEQHRLRSNILDNERRVWVYTPPGYVADGEPYDLLLLFDGDACIEVIPAATILDNLLAERRIPPIVAVLVDSLSQEVRSRELPCYPPFVEFLVEELLPWARERYRITTDPARTVVAGQSYGGLAAAFAGLRRPDVFGSVLSQTGAFWWKPKDDEEHEWLARQYADSPTLPLRFYLDVGLLEIGETPGDGPSQLVANRHMRTVLRAKGYSVHYTEYSGGHDYLCWRGTLVDALIALRGS